MIKRVYMDSTLQTSYCQGGYIHTEERKASPKDSQLFLSICLQLQYCLVTRINELSYYKPARHLFPSSHYPSAQPLHIDVMHPTGIVLEVLGFSQVRGAQGPPSGPPGPIGPSQPYTPPIWEYSVGTLLVNIMTTMFDINCNSQPRSTGEIRLPAFPLRCHSPCQLQGQGTDGSTLLAKVLSLIS